MSQTVSRVFALTTATVVAVAAGYALYFDYQRRHNPGFRKNLKRSLKKQRAQEHAEHEEAKQATMAHVGEYLTMELIKEPIPQDSNEKQASFKVNVEEGEMLAKVPGKELESALKFYRALAMYPSPAELLGIYQRSIPEAVYEYIVLMIAILPPVNVSSFLSGSASTASVHAQPQEAVGIDE
ncbi:AEL318Wp [Eremothecium gossypii ATCC 10895]|uniref:AEL318Wp n=1 Tax=Eremothecium gossypii (strain ATCC 10895 / CBS 109.51 / FGSC 9923 / NRRL Y-1056) TaxID=284811 RepID=Q758S1_EREGS|nr:AEL318Wp [Eremothecium gossypii ATCC 10895]AAS52366.1 AEL318Wp [Eremothecium gossypii ATCC 10895]AEY96663.1 FAEL318Wp [Eremothecium gossypii FDAG1]